MLTCLILLVCCCCSYAKLYRGYPSIIGGLVHVSFKDLTGGITDEVALDSADSGAFDGRLWARIFTYFKEGQPPLISEAALRYSPPPARRTNTLTLFSFSLLFS